MGERDPTRAQVTRQDIGEELTRLLDVKGPLGVLNISDEVQTSVILESLGFVKARSFIPAVKLADRFGGGGIADPANTLQAETTPLDVGIYDLRVLIGLTTVVGSFDFELQWRDAANAVNLMLVDIFVTEGQVDSTFAFNVEAAGERFRVFNFTAIPAGVTSVVTIFAVRRPRSVFPETL